MKVYLDSAATTRQDPRVFEKMKPFLSEFYGNPSSQHSLGRRVKVAIEEARENIADFINASPGEVYFTSGGTEADNFAIKKIAEAEFNESGRNHIITSAAEHHAVLDTVNYLSSTGYETSIISVRDDSTVDPDNLDGVCTEKTSLVSLMHVNNETGAMNDIGEITERSHRCETWFHSDCVQSFGKIPLDVKKLNVDALSASAHKIYGPKGAGILYVRSGAPLVSWTHGGSQERNRRGGTENIPGIIGLSASVSIARDEMSANFKKASKIKNFFTEGLKSIFGEHLIINSPENSSPYILNVTLNNDYYQNDAEAILMYLDIEGIAASNGAACSSGTIKASHVILAMGKKPDYAAGTIRFSFNPQLSGDELEYALNVLKSMEVKFRK